MADLEINTVGRVREILLRRFPNAVIDADRFYGAERINGHIIWDGFEDVDQINRQRQIHAALRQELGAEAQQVSIILAYSPTEWQAMHEDE